MHSLGAAAWSHREIGVTEVYDCFMMSCGVGLLGHWQQQDCYSWLLLRHSHTIRIQWGGRCTAHVPALGDAAPGTLISRRTTGALTTILQGPCRPTVSAAPWSPPPPDHRDSFSPWSRPLIGPPGRPPQPIRGRDDGAWRRGSPGHFTGNLMHSRRVVELSCMEPLLTFPPVLLRPL